MFSQLEIQLSLLTLLADLSASFKAAYEKKSLGKNFQESQLALSAFTLGDYLTLNKALFVLLLEV